MNYTKNGLIILFTTAENYKMKARLHIIPIFGDNLVSNITIKDIDDFIKTKENSGLSVRYICDILALLKAILKYGSQIYDYKNPAIRVCMPKKEKLRSSSWMQMNRPSYVNT